MGTPTTRAGASPDADKAGSRGPSAPVLGAEGLFRNVVDVVPVATVVLDPAGLVMVANRAFCELLNLAVVQVVGEPFLGWLARAPEREGFGRAFLGLRARPSGAGFAVDLGLTPRLGPRIDCLVRSSRLDDGHVVVTCTPSRPHGLSPEAELGLAVTRSLDALDQGVLWVDAEGMVVHANPAGVALLGEGIVGRSVLELTSGPSVRVLARALGAAQAGSWQGEVALRRLDGEPLPVELSLAAGDGPAVVFLRDLRERKRREFEARLTAQVDRCLVGGDDPRRAVMDAAVALGEAVRAGGIVVLARTGSGWERWTVGDAGRYRIDLGGEIVPPAGWERARDFEVVDPSDPEVRGHLRDIEAVTQAGQFALRAPAGVVGHLLLAHRQPQPWDERDRLLIGTVASQIALGLASGLLTLETRELAAFQAMMLDQTSVLIDSVDESGRVVTWNRASEQLLGVSGDAAVGRRLGVDIGVAADPQQWAALWRSLLEDGSVTREITLMRGDEEIPLHLEGRRLSAGNRVRGAVFVGLDLRDRKALEAQILRSQKLAAVGLLAAGIAHELNNPLSGVVGYSKLLLEKELPTQVRERVEKIAQSGERCRKIVEGVLLFSRQRDQGVRRRVDLETLVSRVIAIGEYQWRMHNVRILRERTESTPVVVDADQLEQVVLNLLANAAEAMPRGGTVHVSVHPGEAGGAVLSVADHGPGIPEEIQVRIFDPFFSTKEIGKGTGLGLAISYGIVHDHGGEIAVESTLGQGARFTVKLPACGTEGGQNP